MLLLSQKQICSLHGFFIFHNFPSFLIGIILRNGVYFNMIFTRTHNDAAKKLGLSIKRTRKLENIEYIIDKSIPNPQIQWRMCKICGQKSPSAKCRKGYCQNCKHISQKIANQKSKKFRTIWKNCVLCKKKVKSSECRSGYCRTCTQSGLGAKERGKKLSKLYTGKGNPNYVHGKTKQCLAERKNQWFKWGRFVLYRDEVPNH